MTIDFDLLFSESLVGGAIIFGYQIVIIIAAVIDNLLLLLLVTVVLVTLVVIIVVLAIDVGVGGDRQWRLFDDFVDRALLKHGRQTYATVDDEINHKTNARQMTQNYVVPLC